MNNYYTIFKLLVRKNCIPYLVNHHLKNSNLRLEIEEFVSKT